MALSQTLSQLSTYFSDKETFFSGKELSPDNEYQLEWNINTSIAERQNNFHNPFLWSILFRSRTVHSDLKERQIKGAAFNARRGRVIVIDWKKRRKREGVGIPLMSDQEPPQYLLWPERILELSPIHLEDGQGGSFSLIGKMLTTKSITMGNIKGATRRPWSSAGSIDIKFLKDNTFIFTFSSEANRDLIWSKRPWVIADHLLVLKKGDDYNNPDEVPFDSMDPWVQMHNLPARYKSLENIKTVANSYFKYKDVDRAGLQQGTWHRFVRVWAEERRRLQQPR
ncbi:hypothetical protein LINPERPRIM_LOCUS6205 [Linum perenne]